MRRIGFINGSEAEMNRAFFDELERLGYVAGRNLVVETRLLTGAPGELQRFIGELARADIEFLVAGALPMAAAMREADPEMPMLIATCPGMISNRFAQTLERPGGIVTGMDELPTGLTAKRLSLLKSAAPAVSRVALLSTTPGTGGHETQLRDAEQAAAALRVGARYQRAIPDRGALCRPNTERRTPRRSANSAPIAVFPHSQCRCGDADWPDTSADASLNGGSGTLVVCQGRIAFRRRDALRQPVEERR